MKAGSRKQQVSCPAACAPRARRGSAYLRSQEDGKDLSRGQGLLSSAPRTLTRYLLSAISRSLAAPATWRASGRDGRRACRLQSSVRYLELARTKSRDLQRAIQSFLTSFLNNIAKERCVNS